MRILHRCKKKNVITEVYFGLLYNFYAATDARNIANTGWHVPTHAERNTMTTYIGGNTGGAYKLRITGTTYWNTDTGATNQYGFNGKGGGARYNPGIWDYIKNIGLHWTQTSTTVALARNYEFLLNGNIAINGTYKWQGFSIRLIKDVTTLSHGQEGTYTGNDGKVYKTICIGTQEWLAENLIETKFRNGDTIPWYGADQASYFTHAEWKALTSAGVCAYNNDLTLVAPGFSFPT